MELIEIIYKILILGGILLVCVIVVSYLISRTKGEDNFSNDSMEEIVNKKYTPEQEIINYEQILLRKKSASPQPKIFHIDDSKPKAVKIIRKPTVSQRDIQEEIRLEEMHLNLAERNGKRYTIVNDQMKKSKFRAANFYL